MVGVFPFPDLRIVVDMALNQLEIILAAVGSLTKPVGGLSALLDHFGDMVGVFRFSQIYILWYIWPLNQLGDILAVVESLTKPVGGHEAHLDHFGDMVGVFRFFPIYILW